MEVEEVDRLFVLISAFALLKIQQEEERETSNRITSRGRERGGEEGNWGRGELGNRKADTLK